MHSQSVGVQTVPLLPTVCFQSVSVGIIPYQRQGHWHSKTRKTHWDSGDARLYAIVEGSSDGMNPSLSSSSSVDSDMPPAIDDDVISINISPLIAVVWKMQCKFGETHTLKYKSARNIIFLGNETVARPFLQALNLAYQGLKTAQKDTRKIPIRRQCNNAGSVWQGIRLKHWHPAWTSQNYSYIHFSHRGR